MFEALGSLIHRRRWATLALAAAFLAFALVLLARGDALSAPTVAGIEADEAQQVLDEIAGRREDMTLAVIFRSPDLRPTDPAFRDAMRDALAPVRADPRIEAVVTPDDAPGLLVDRMRNAEAHAALAFVTFRGNLKSALAAYPEIRERLRSDSLTIHCGGQIPFVRDLATTLEHDLLRAELLSLPVAIVILLLVFRTAVASFLPVVVGGLAVLGGIAIVVALSHVVDVSQYTVNVCSLIGFGVAIDYSLFIVSRYREELSAGKSFHDALVITLNTAGRAVTFSGFAVATGLAGLFFFRGSYLAIMGVGGAIVVFLAVVFALTLLPALLAILGPRIHRGRIPGVRATRPGGGRSWSTIARSVMRRPWLVFAATFAVLLTLAAPASRLRIAASDVRMLPAGADARRAFEDFSGAFPNLGSPRIAVLVRFPQGPVVTPERVSALYDLSRRVAKIPHVVRVESLVDREPTEADPDPPSREDLIDALTSPSETAAPMVEEAKRFTTSENATVLYLIADVPPETREAEEIVRAVRRDRRVLDGSLIVTGQAARDVDTTEFLLSRAPRAVAFVVGVTFVVLLVLLRSVILPFKAIAMNALSIAACFGVLVWIFQDGHLWVTDGRPLEPTLPVLLFCISFGMSMDYEVLMLVRMKEIYDRTDDNVEAVAEGLTATGGLITSAAAIMVAVFAAFALARIVVLQATGVGLAAAVALDATLVRALLVPATMRLFGHLNWWAPAWLKRHR